MRHDPTYVVFAVQTSSRDEAERLQARLSQAARPDATMAVTTVSSETTQEIAHRLGDYFEEIQILPDWNGNIAAFGLVFHRRGEAGRYWKDLMVRLIRSVEENNPPGAVKIIYKGDESLDWRRLSLASHET
jgi:hypothetical protein